MTIKEVTRHAAAEEQIEQALEDVWGRAFGRWHEIRCGDMPLRCGPRELGKELADHLAARTVSDPACVRPTRAPP
ncbi:hypothetical protein [Streptomyces sp. LN245]|uniref:hypothetical protein n=1 Tax=Streptomyces sp. LN245 TaxID=3112975 RepID=UPI00371A117C